MKKNFQKLQRAQVQERIDQFDKIKDKQRPGEGWVKTIRQALGMSNAALAKRLNCSPANIAAMERREKAGTISIELLEQAAQALNGKLVYAIIPHEPLEHMLKQQAQKVAQKQLKRVLHSMALEQQALTDRQKEQQEKALMEELLQGNTKRLWDE